MITQTFTIKQFDWHLKIIYANTDCILEELERLNCPEFLIQEASEYIDTCKINCGITYSNGNTKHSIIAILAHDSIEQVYNTCVHELYHLIRQIATIEENTEEEQATLIGNLFMEMLPAIRDLIESM